MPAMTAFLLKLAVQIFAHFAMLAPFSRIKAELGIDIATINAMLTIRWQDDLHHCGSNCIPMKRLPHSCTDRP